MFRRSNNAFVPFGLLALTLCCGCRQLSPAGANSPRIELTPVGYSPVVNQIDAPRSLDELSADALNSTHFQSDIEETTRRVRQDARPISNDVGNMVAKQFTKFAGAIGLDANTVNAPLIDDHGSIVFATKGEWRYRVDVGFNQSLAPVSSIPTLAPDRTIDSNAADPRLASFKVKTEAIARKLGLASGFNKSVTRREVLVLARCGIRSYRFYPGRYLCRMFEGPRYFQVTYDRNGRPIRIDTNAHNEDVDVVADGLLTNLQLHQPDFKPVNLGVTSMTFGAFFGRINEWVFEANARSFEGYDALVPTWKRVNPFNPDKQTSLFWASWWNDDNGRQNGIRGNYNAETGKWERPGISILHKPLDEYVLNDGSKEGDSKPLESRFFNDLEKCTVAVVCTHGGPVNGKFQIGMAPHTWGIPTTKLGNGQLRHLFYECCGAMGAFAEGHGKGYESVFGEWLTGRNAAGVRTVCGYDGGASAGVDRGGWRVINGLCGLDSVADAWRNAALRESPEGDCPVTVCYGSTPQSAFAALDKGLSAEKVLSRWAVASILREVDK